jgi:type IV/VI secretion system ImpK/VasF family protein
MRNASASGGRRLWFEIARVLAEIQRLCQEAKAVDLRASPSLGESLDPDATDPAFGRPLEIDILLPDAPGNQPPMPVDVVALRSEIRSRLNLLKSRLSEVLTEREVYYTLFPIVVYVDELVQLATRGRAAAWPPLQRELYDIDNGGELFYTIIETLLKREETSPLIFETFYFCLSAGFLGQFQSEPSKIEEYKARLAFRIPVPESSGGGANEPPPVELVRFPTWYYVAAAGVLLGVYLMLHLFGALETGALG